MTRSDLVDVVWSRHGGISRREAQELVETILGIIKSRLATGERVSVPGLGSLQVVSAPARVRRHPVTGRRIRRPGRKNLVFRPSVRLDRALNRHAQADRVQELA